MDISEILNKLDSLNYTETEDFLRSQIEQAKQSKDADVLLALLNEMIGFCRDSCQFDKTRLYADEILSELHKRHLEGTKAYATSLLNIANAERASGSLKESLSHYKEVSELYKQLLPADDFLIASLNNNMSLLYQEMGDYEASCQCLKKALSIVQTIPDGQIETAVTCTNLAQSLLCLQQINEAKKYNDEALTLFAADGNRDYHYSAALSVYAQIKFMEHSFKEAADYFEKAMNEFEKHMGKNGNYNILKENRDYALEKLEEEQKAAHPEKVQGLELCEEYFKEYGLPMLQDKFGKYLPQIAVGLVGEGSDCFGLDDEFSRDHDWGPGFCLWLPDDLYEAIGASLQQAYDELPKQYKRYTRIETKEGRNRTGVKKVSDFYQNYLSYVFPKTEEEWFTLQEELLAVVTNGKVFMDEAGAFTMIRNYLKQYYPQTVYIKKLGMELIKAAQCGQYNFIRMLNRGDKVTARLYLSEFMEHILHIVFLLNRQYAPYKKWLQKKAASLQVLPELTDILNAINDMQLDDRNIPLSIEIIARLIIDEMQKQNLIIVSTDSVDSNYLEPYGKQLIQPKETKMTKEQLIEQIVKEEWEAFDKVKNEGGRASCQDDWNTFEIMRKSQYMQWTEQMIESYLKDFADAREKNWNLITEKYGRMMESTAKDQYDKIKEELPKLSDQKKAIIEEIVKIQVGFMEQLAEKYPKVAGTARSIHTSEDTPYNTSYETYLRGELGTYSDETLSLYGQFIVEIAKRNGNLAKDIMRNTALLYGYQSLEELEERL